MKNRHRLQIIDNSSIDFYVKYDALLSPPLLPPYLSLILPERQLPAPRKSSRPTARRDPPQRPAPAEPPPAAPPPRWRQPHFFARGLYRQQRGGRSPGPAELRDDSPAASGDSDVRLAWFTAGTNYEITAGEAMTEQKARRPDRE
jgi:hypothetical protein